jgi:hypothetical protein
VHAAGARIDDAGKLVGIGAAQFGQAAVVEDQPGQFMRVRDRFQRFLVGRRLALRRLKFRRQAELVEQDRLQMLGRVEVELAP